MTDSLHSKRLTHLTVAVWVLAAFVALNFAGDIYRVAAPRTHGEVSESPSEFVLPDPWDGLTFEQKLARSSAVLITDTVNDGRKVRGIVREILVMSPEAKVFYKVGEDLPFLAMSARAGTNYGDGAIVLLEGSPASVKESHSIQQGRVPSLGHMPLSELRQLVESL